MISTKLGSTPVLSLTPDSISQLGNLDSSSLSELWNVFTKCKDSLKDGRRLENISWRLWFDSSRRELALLEEEESGNQDLNYGSQIVTQSHVSNSEVDWSDPEWSEASDSDSEEELSIANKSQQQHHHHQQQHQSSNQNNNNNNNNIKVTVTSLLPSITRPITSRVNSGGRSACPLTGGSLERMIIGLTTLPAITSHAYNAIPLPTTPLILDSRSTKVNGNTPPPLIAVPEFTTKVDAPTQTTPSTSHRPSPAMKSPIALRRLSNQLPSPQPTTINITSGTSLLSNSSANSRPSLSRRATSSILTAAAEQEHAKSLARAESEIQLRRNDSFEPRSYVKGFDTTVFESRPLPGSIAPPPTPSTQASLSLVSAPLLAGLTSSRNVATPPPSAMKSTTNNNKKVPMTSNKKIFFISSHSDSEEEGSSSLSVGSNSIGLESRRKRSSVTGSYKMGSTSIPFDKVPPPPPQNSVSNAVASSSKLPSASSNRPTTTVINPASADEWDDEDSTGSGSEDDDDDASSGWGSEYSTESESNSKVKTTTTTTTTILPPTNTTTVERKSKALFAKRPSLPISTNNNNNNNNNSNQFISELKPRGPGLLSQLFHPDLIKGGLGLTVEDRSRSELDIRNGKRLISGGGEGLQSSKSTGGLTEQLRNKSFLRGAPIGTEMESDSEDEPIGGQDGSDGFEDEDSSPTLNNATTVEQKQQHHQTQAVSNSLYRQQQSQLQLEQLAINSVPIAPPQTPRTTRRAMLATELSESLRRNLLWERQTRNRIMGGPVSARFAPLPIKEETLPSTTTTTTNSNNTTTNNNTRNNSRRSKSKQRTSVVPPPPPPILRRRNTTGTGLYLEGQMNKLAEGYDQSEDLSESDEEDEEEEEVSREGERLKNGNGIGGGGGGGGGGRGYPNNSFTGGLHSHGW